MLTKDISLSPVFHGIRERKKSKTDRREGGAGVRKKEDREGDKEEGKEREDERI